LPPVAASVCEYATPVTPAGRGDDVVIESCAVIVIESALVAVCDALSVTWTVKFAVPADVGDPLIAPPDDNPKPAGSVPTVMDQVYGAVPPVAPRVWEYAVPTSPPGNDAVEIASVTGLIMMESNFVAVCEAVSVT